METFLEVFAGGILLILILVVVHELGHLFAARACGVGVESFSIGFGPGFKMFTLRGIPFYFRCILLGGYVAIKSRKKPGCVSEGKYIEDASWRQKSAIFFAGAGCNLLLAIILRTAIYWFAPHEMKVEIFLLKFSFLPLQGAWYWAPLYAAKDVFLIFAALLTFIFLRIWFMILPIVKMAPVANGGLIGMIGLGANAQLGFWSFCGLVYFVSIIAAAFQLLPFFPFDGGHIVTALVERIFGEGKISRALGGVLRWLGIVILAVIIINMVMSDVFDIFGIIKKWFKSP